MSGRRPRWGEVRRFCLRQGYTHTRTDHDYYAKPLPDGLTSTTKISMGADGDRVPPNMWKLVWRHELRLASEEDFWKGVNDEPFAYDVPPTLESPQPLPDYPRRFLTDTLHLTEEEIDSILRDDAQRLLNDYYSHPH